MGTPHVFFKRSIINNYIELYSLKRFIRACRVGSCVTSCNRIFNILYIYINIPST